MCDLNQASVLFGLVLPVSVVLLIVVYVFLYYHVVVVVFVLLVPAK